VQVLQFELQFVHYAGDPVENYPAGQDDKQKAPEAPDTFKE